MEAVLNKQLSFEIIIRGKYEVEYDVPWMISILMRRGSAEFTLFCQPSAIDLLVECGKKVEAGWCGS